jgi:hypothetical protein
MLGECSEDEDSCYYSIRGSTTKVDDLGVEFLSSDEKNGVLGNRWVFVFPCLHFGAYSFCISPPGRAQPPLTFFFQM